MQVFFIQYLLFTQIIYEMQKKQNLTEYKIMQ
jgi:hypothetical protein